jgi:hypothetical protein
VKPNFHHNVKPNFPQKGETQLSPRFIKTKRGETQLSHNVKPNFPQKGETQLSPKRWNPAFPKKVKPNFPQKGETQLSPQTLPHII